MNVPALMGAVFGTAITYATTEDTKLTLIGATAGLITAGILNSDQNNYSGPGDFSKSACASVWPVLFYDEKEDVIPFYLDDEPMTNDEESILDLPIYFD